MQNYRDSDYALNKFSVGIVYRFIDGTIVTVNTADYIADNPGMAEGDFQKIKKDSDRIYLKQAKGENAQTKKNSHFDELDGIMPVSAMSPEEMLIGEIEAREEAERLERRKETANRALATLTDAQRRRYILHYAEGFTLRKIAGIEGVAFQVIDKSIKAAEKKINSFLAKNR